MSDSLPSLCRNCRFWSPENDLGECRRKSAPWARTGGDDWCGQYIGVDGFLFVSPRDLPKEEEECPF